MDNQATYPQAPVDNSPHVENPGETVHKPKGWVITRAGRRRGNFLTKSAYWFVVTCSCGWETPLCQNENIAKERWLKHMGLKPGEKLAPPFVEWSGRAKL